MPRPFAILDVKQARRDLRRFSAELYKTEPRALKLAGKNVRRAYCSAIARGRTKALPVKVAMTDKKWRAIMNPWRKKQGGGLSQARLWPIRRDGAHGVTVDILAPYQKTLERYQTGRTGVDLTLHKAVDFLRAQRGNVLNTGRLGEFFRDKKRHKYSRSVQIAVARISDWLYKNYPQSPDWRVMMHYADYRAGAGIETLRRDFSAVFSVDHLPRITKQPERPIVGHVRSWASKNLSEWYLSILRKLASGKIKPGKLTRTGPFGLTQTA